MERSEIEPGLVPVFRMYTLVRLIVMPLLAGFYYFRFPLKSEPALFGILTLFVFDIVGLLLLLSVHWFAQHLGRYLLPLALIASGVLPLIEVRSAMTLYAAANMPDFWLVFPFAVVPLILTAWQYRFQVVVAFVGLLAAVEGAFLISGTFTSPMHAIYSWASLAGRSAMLLLIGHIVTTLMEEQREQRKQLREANRRLVRYAGTLEQLAISRERNRLARELHDTLAHALSALTVQLDASIAIRQQAPERSAEMVDRALMTARSGLDDTRRALASLRAAPLDDLGLTLSLQSLVESAAERGALRITMAIDDGLEELDPEIEQAYFRVAQEALENTVRHARARNVTVSLKRDGPWLTLEIADDGQGFDLDTPDDRYGLQGMRERAQLIGAQLSVESSPERGTVVRLSKELVP
ncbi:MAG: sensor histidine kinase [Anaerolineales bacterium]